MNTNGIIFQNALMTDVSGLIELEKKVWGEELGAGEDIWLSRISIYPEGVFIAREGNTTVGTLVIHRPKWDYENGYFPSWEEATASGYISNHDNESDLLYGVNMSVLDDYPGIASKFIENAVKFMRQEKISRALMGGRIPSLARQVAKLGLKEDDLSVDEVMRLAKKDLTVKFFCSNYWRMISAKRDYFPGDSESLGWGIIMEIT